MGHLTFLVKGMKKRKLFSARCLPVRAALFAAALLGFGALVRAADNAAATMQITKTEGTVEVTDAAEGSVPPMKRMRLYNGYGVGTLEESYAWISLDKSKLAKLDALSEISVRKRGKKLEILLDSGNIFFNVTEPLKDDESLNIRTSTMAVGIRGTSGWVEVLDQKNVRVSILEGTVELTAADPITGDEKTELLSAGESAVCVVYDGENPGLRGG